jgi:hypothetical protein
VTGLQSLMGSGSPAAPHCYTAIALWRPTKSCQGHADIRYAGAGPISGGAMIRSLLAVGEPLQREWSGTLWAAAASSVQEWP